MFLHPQIPDFQIVFSRTNIVQTKPYINWKLVYSDLRWCMNLNKNTKLTLMTSFVVQGHKYQSDRNVP